MAGKESSIEVALDKMAADWADAEIAVLEYRDTGTYVIKLDEALLQQLDDHIGTHIGLTSSQRHVPQDIVLQHSHSSAPRHTDSSHCTMPCHSRHQPLSLQ